jgi:hypothetical protein
MGIALLFSLGLIGFSTTASKITFERILQRSFLVLSSAFCLEQRFIRLVKLSREGMAALRVAPFDYQELLATTRRAPRSSAQPHTEQPKTEGNGYRCRGGH